MEGNRTIHCNTTVCSSCNQTCGITILEYFEGVGRPNLYTAPSNHEMRSQQRFELFITRQSYNRPKPIALAAASKIAQQRKLRDLQFLSAHLDNQLLSACACSDAVPKRSYVTSTDSDKSLLLAVLVLLTGLSANEVEIGHDSLPNGIVHENKWAHYHVPPREPCCLV